MAQTLKLKHAPNLNTVLMVEETLKDMDDSIIKISELKKKLPRQVNHRAIMAILEYLEMSNKIVVSIKGITWIHSPNPKLKKAISLGMRL